MGGNGRQPAFGKESQTRSWVSGAGNYLTMFGDSLLIRLFLMSAILWTKGIGLLLQTWKNCVLGVFQKHLEDL